MRKATNLKTKAVSVILVLLMALAFLPVQAFAEDVGVTGVTLSSNSLSMKVRDTHKLNATISPENATNTAVTWESNNPSVASVDATGTVTAKSTGIADIYVTTKDGVYTASCEVTVTAATVAVTGVSLNSASLSLTVGGSSTLTATVTPSDATNKTVSWSSSDAAVVTVDSSGKVTAQKAGSAAITAATADGGKTATCSVTVTAATASSYTVVATPVTDDNKKGGTVSIDSTSSSSYSDGSTSKIVTSGASVTVRAKANSGYSFLGWYEYDVLLTTSTTYSATVTKARELEARFAKGTIYTITTYASPSAGGTVTGGGKYKSGDTVTLEATPKNGYTFEGWYEGSTTSSRKSRETTYKFNAKANVTVYAKFTDGTYEITVKKSGNGEVDGGGKYEEGERCTIEATPDKGYVFDGWYEGSESVSTRREYTFTVRKNRTFTGKFVKAGTTTTATTTTAAATTTTTATSATAKTSELAQSQATKSAKEAAASAQKDGKKNATVKLKNVGDVSLETLKAMRKEAGMELKFQADTMTENGKSVDVRITIDPSKATKNVNLSASKTNEKSQKTRTFFAKWFSNTTQVLILGQSDTFGCDVEIAVKLDFKEMDKNNLVFYSYNSSKNTYKKIEPTKSWIDKNGYLHIRTNAAGNLVISNGKLKKK